jgi:chemotaxis protein methyltransferase CheR
VRISATDLNPAALHEARIAEYREWSFRTVPESVRKRWFRRKGSSFTPVSDVKRLVRFWPFNLANGSFKNCPQNVNVIFCRNVVTYLCPSGQQLLVHSADCLKPLRARVIHKCLAQLRSSATKA